MSRANSLSYHPTEPKPAGHPASPLGEPTDLGRSEKLCRRLARSHYENFVVASALLPREFRQPFYNIYAFCRTADDVADESATPRDARVGLSELQSGIDALFADRTPQTGFFPALADTVQRFDLSKQHFDDLLSAFRQDQQQVRYATTQELIDYCDRSANPVGRLLLELADSLDETTVKLSDEICTGLQLVNFWQDVARDFRKGRVYLPEDRCKEFGFDLDRLDQTATPAELRALLEALCLETESRFRTGLQLPDLVPRWLATDIKLFAHGGMETLRAIRQINYDVLRIRPKVSKFAQLTLTAKAFLGWL